MFSIREEEEGISLLKESDRGEKDEEEGGRKRNENGSTLSGREKRERGLI